MSIASKSRPFLTKDNAAAAKGDSAGRYELRDKRVTGLRLAVQPSGRRSWLLRYTIGGRDRKWTIGDYSDALGLAEARDIAAGKKLEIVKGADPAAEKAEARRNAASGIVEGQLFANNWTDWEQAPKPKSRSKKGWRPSTALRVRQLYRNTLEHRWRKRRLDEIAKADISALLNSIASKHPQAAARIHRVITSFFNWCVSNDRLAKSPCDGIEPGATSANAN